MGDAPGSGAPRPDARALSLVVVTVSDRASRGELADLSGPRACELVRDHFVARGWTVTERRELVPDDRGQIRAALREALGRGADLVLTSGGTGLGPRDVTPDVTRELIDREIPGLIEAVRARYRTTIPQVDLSRALAGQAGPAIVLNLPGSPKAVAEFLAVLLPVLPHAVEIARGGHEHP
jgi:molybdenum cofactor synthesis domain-containing protein